MLAKREIIFFFQAEDGIRDVAVTGVQTCALPISRPGAAGRASAPRTPRGRRNASRGAWLQSTESVPRRSARRMARMRGHSSTGRTSSSESSARPMSYGQAVDVNPCCSAHRWRRHNARRCRTQMALVPAAGVRAPRGAKNVTPSVPRGCPSSVESTRMVAVYASGATVLLPNSPRNSPPSRSYSTASSTSSSRPATTRSASIRFSPSSRSGCGTSRSRSRAACRAAGPHAEPTRLNTTSPRRSARALPDPRDRVDLNPYGLGKRGRLHGGARGLVRREVLGVHLVHGGEGGHVDEGHPRLHDEGQARALAPQHPPPIPGRLLSLLGGVFVADVARP